MLIDGPSTDNLSAIIPTGTKINKVELKGDVLEADFSDELTKGISKEQKAQIISSITDTVIQLNEVNSVKITVNGNAV
ncbi:MAG: GerMN domain-containing protein [Oscillospiraceae bacterium]|nr:GerMN domain-containing protein [Oscillospiraceae bacterium]